MMTKWEKVTEQQVTENTGHMRNYRVMCQYLGFLNVHCGFSSTDHMETIRQFVRQHMGNVKIQYVEMNVGKPKPATMFDRR